MKEKEKQSSFYNQFSSIITVEDHLHDCGFGSWFKEAINNSNSNRKFSSIALPPNVIDMVANEDEILKNMKAYN